MMRSVILALVLCAGSVVPAWGAIEYYVDPTTGDDGRTEAEARNPATPWATVKTGAMPKVAHATDACNVNVTNGTSESVAAYLNLNYNYTNLVTIRPVTDPGNGVSAITFTATSGGGAVLRPYHATSVTCAKIAFEHCTFSAPASYSVFYSSTAGTMAGIHFSDCTFTMLAVNQQLWNSTGGPAINGLYFTRCTFTAPANSTSGYAYLVFGTDAGAKTASNMVFTDCTMTAGCQGLRVYTTGDNIRVIGGDWTSKGIPIHIGSQSVVGNRITNVVIDGVTATHTASSHVVYVNADGAIIQNCVIDAGATGDYPLVTKYGTGYVVVGNTLHARAAGSAGMAIKGAKDGTYCGNKIFMHAGQYAFQIYFNTEDAGTECKNIAVVLNDIYTNGTTAILYNPTKDAAGYVLVNANRYIIGGSGNSNILGTTATGSTIDNMQAAWATEGFSFNEVTRLKKYQAPAGRLIPR